MSQYTITLTDSEEKALRWAAVDPQDWIENFVRERCRVAIDEIVAAEWNKIMAGAPAPEGGLSRENLVLAADIQSAAERQSQQPGV